MDMLRAGLIEYPGFNISQILKCQKFNSTLINEFFSLNANSIFALEKLGSYYELLNLTKALKNPVSFFNITVQLYRKDCVKIYT